MTRRLVLFLGHVPGLWLFYGERISPELVRPNLIALALTAFAIVGAALTPLATPWWANALVAWAMGHVAWGLYFAVHSPEADQT